MAGVDAGEKRGSRSKVKETRHTYLKQCNGLRTTAGACNWMHILSKETQHLNSLLVGLCKCNGDMYLYLDTYLK